MMKRYLYYVFLRTVQGLTYNVLKLLMEMDSSLFEQCSMQCTIEEENSEKRKTEADKKWGVLNQRFAP